MSSLTDLVESFSRLRVLVLGDAMLDVYHGGTSRRLCQEAPVPIVDIQQRMEMPGGAANSAVNLVALGAQAIFLGVTGADEAGETLRALLQSSGVDTGGLYVASQRCTLSKTRVLCDHHLVVRFDQGSTSPLDESTEGQLLDTLEQWFPHVDAVLVSDYGYGTITPTLLQRLARCQAKHPTIIAVDSKNLSQFRGLSISVCKPNYPEAVKLLGESLDAGRNRVDSAIAMGARLLAISGARIVALTLDRDGALIFQTDCPPYRTSAQPAPMERAAGAGDTFLSAMTLGLAAGADAVQAADIASAAANIAVSRDHTACCSSQELGRYLSGERGPWTDLTCLRPLLDQYRRRQSPIVLTNGCFDILHQGHIKYLNEAKRLGEILIVGVNTDESIRRLKGPGRPINSLADRVGVLSALSCVDHVVTFDEDTPHRIIEAIRPDIFVKGGDYTVDSLPEAELVTRLGGKITILPFVENRSTTGIIDRICRTYGNRSEDQDTTRERNDYANRRLGQRPARAMRQA